MSNDTTYRTCKDCKQPFPETAEYFPTNKVKGKTYLRHFCRDCWRIRKNKSDHKHWQAVQARKRNWRINNPDKVRAQKQRSHIRNREHNNNRSVKWYHANLEENRAKSRENYHKNKQPYFDRANQRIHRKRANGGSFTQAEIDELYETQAGMCGYCFEPLNKKKMHKDHYIPVSKGGNNYIENIVLACEPCNLSKGDKLPSEWKGRLA